MPKVLRITTAPQAIRGFLIDQVNYIQKSGFDIKLVSGQGEEDWVEIKTHTTVSFYVLDIKRNISLYHDLMCLVQLIRLFRKEKPDIVHTMTPKAGLLGMVAAFVCRVPIRIHDVVGMVQEAKSGLLFLVLDAMERITYFCAQELIPNSFSLKEYILSRKMTAASKIKILGKGSSHGINLTRFDKRTLNDSDLEAVKLAISYDANCKYITAIGRMVKDKGINELVEGFGALQQTHKDLKLVLIGPFEPALDPLEQETIQRIETNKDIIHIPFSKQVEYFLSLSTILVHASHREGLPNVLLEAGAMGCPIVCARATGNVDVVQHEETGLIFEVKDCTDLVEKVDFALKNPAKMSIFADNLLAVINQYFSHTVVNNYVLENYKFHLAKQK